MIRGLRIFPPKHRNLRQTTSYRSNINNLSELYHFSQCSKEHTYNSKERSSKNPGLVIFQVFWRFGLWKDTETESCSKAVHIIHNVHNKNNQSLVNVGTLLVQSPHSARSYILHDSFFGIQGGACTVPLVCLRIRVWIYNLLEA